MAIKVSQNLRQSQNLVMTPQLQQAIKMLTLTHLEMANVITEEMKENPMLEELDLNASSQSQETDLKEEHLEMQNKEATAENFEKEGVVEKDDFDWQSYIEVYNSTSSSPPSVSTPDFDEMPNYENLVSRGQTLAEHLEWQWRMEDLSQEEYELGMNLIHNINDDGYLSVSFEEILAHTKLERDEAIKIWNLIKRLDPVGCACESLSDCLLTQARFAEERSPLLEKIICYHLPDLQSHHYSKIAKALGVSREQVLESAKLLKQFHPKPGRLVGSNDTHYIVPDIYVTQAGGEFVVKVNDEGVPRLKISPLYKKLLTQSGSSEDNHKTSDYVKEKLSSALWLIKSIQNRQKTIYRVAQAIVAYQQEFFKKGVVALKPMILKDIAQELGMHESTVSRVTNNKYMHTPIGLFELKYFFNASLGGKNGGLDIAGEVIKVKIKEMIASENPKKPLSDQKIANLLSRDDVKIARRTVAKYRESLGILSSSKRRRCANA